MTKPNLSCAARAVEQHLAEHHANCRAGRRMPVADAKPQRVATKAKK